MESLVVKGAKGLVGGPRNLILREMDALRPKWLFFAMTDLCNSHCTMCNIWQNKTPGRNLLTADEVRKALSDPLFRDVCYINNTGGEITTRSDLKEVLLAEHEALPKATLQLSTNGILPERAYEATKFCLEHGIKTYVGVSLDGIGEKHDRIRGTKGNFESVDKLLHQLAELRKEYKDQLWVAVGSVLMDETLPNLDEVRAYVKKLDMNHEVQWYNAAPYYSNSGTSRENMREAHKKAVRALPQRILTEKWLDWLDGKPINFRCFALYSFCVLKSNGDMAPCLSHWDANIGNVRKSTPTEIWKSALAKEARKNVVKKCQGCINSWGTNWSFSESFYPFLFYYLRHPKALRELERAT